MVTLQTPRSGHHIYRLVERLFLAITAESNVSLQNLLTEDSVMRFAGGESQSAFVSWVRRFGTSDYTTLRSDQLYREGEIEVYSASDLEQLAEPRRVTLRPGPKETLVVIPLQTQVSLGKTVFGTELELLIRDSELGLLIVAFAEDYQPP